MPKTLFYGCKPELLDIYRRKWTYMEKWGGQRIDTSKRFLYVRPLFARYLPQTSIHTFRCNNSFLMILWRFSVFRRCVPCFLTLRGSKKRPFGDPLRISTRVLVRMICPCFIEQIWVYIPKSAESTNPVRGFIGLRFLKTFLVSQFVRKAAAGRFFLCRKVGETRGLSNVKHGRIHSSSLTQIYRLSVL